MTIVQQSGLERFVSRRAVALPRICSKISAARAEARRRLVVVQSVTKSYAMSPWRIGYAVAPAPLAEQIAKLLEWEVLMVSHVAQAAAEATIGGPAEGRPHSHRACRPGLAGHLPVPTVRSGRIA